MDFRNKQNNSPIPEVNLIPLMDVMMSVLTFFIITSMSYTGQRLGDINLPGLPGTGTPSGESNTRNTLVIGLNRQGEILVDNQVITINQMSETIQSYLEQNQNATVVFKADRDLPYEDVQKLLKEMTIIGGDRVSLAIERR
ncbi:MAG: biopolymer transporter ExbD [Coleofasciculus chthonoplastes F3-SA18-01]|jgi:biopolymer transport protein ExbD|uniref:ExbD/TolR family protein n=1 Tax=Coleofasciculus chthonoplastes TaxID=64178 RepID=UPI0032F9B1A7